MKDNRKKMTITMIALIIFVFAVIGATFAYFTAQTGGGVGADIRATTDTTDSLRFDDGRAINISATLDSFAKGKASLEDETTVTATLMANNTTNQAS